MKSLPKLVVIGGITASGKTEISIEAAKKFDGEIVNCDSRQVYKGLDIGTAKEKFDKRNTDGTVTISSIVHHLIDYVDPHEDYSLARFQCDAFTAIDAILAKGKLPLLVGGTGLYIDSVVYNFRLNGDEPSEEQRAQLSKMNVEELQERLRSLNNDLLTKMNKSDINNPHRLIRAIERATDSATKKRGPIIYNPLYLVLDLSDKELEKNITDRVDRMFEEGLVEENKLLRDEGLTPEHTALSSIGYSEFDAYFSGEQTLDETKALIKLHTRQYAKRQRTWFSKNKETTWIKHPEDTLEEIAEFLTVS